MKVTAFVVALGLGSCALAPDEFASLRRNSFEWNQEERELGFLHFDKVFGGRNVPSGDAERPWKEGPPIQAFSEGGERQRQLDEFLADQKVAGLLVAVDGEIRLERYALGHGREGRWTSQSVAKSVTSTLVGAAIQDGFIQGVDDKLTTYIPDLEGSGYDGVTVGQLLTMSTGVRWVEDYTNPNSDLIKFFRRPVDRGVDQTVSYLRSLPADAEPGTRWLYSTGETHLLGVLVSSATGQSLSDYLAAKIWRPYGMEHDATWTLNATGQELAGCCLHMGLRDAARFAQLVLDGGRIDGEPIVQDGWFEAATRSHFPVWGPLGYGYQWWTYTDGTFRALGIHGQTIHIDPARRLVVVLSSAWPEAENFERRTADSVFINAVAAEVDLERGSGEPGRSATRSSAVM
ncbi:MAG: serine hydrolase [Acidobacteriota bacterium]